MPEVKKKEQNEKFYNLLLELIKNQEHVVEKIDKLLEQNTKKTLSASEAWDKM